MSKISTIEHKNAKSYNLPMKKLNRIFASVFSAFFVLTFSSCSDLFSSDSEGGNTNLALIAALLGGSSSDAIYMNASATWNYSDSNDIYEVAENVGELNISGNLSGKTVYFANVNTSDSAITYPYVKYIYNISGSDFTLNISGDMVDPVSSSDMAEAKTDFASPQLFNYEPKFTPVYTTSASNKILFSQTESTLPPTQLSLSASTNGTDGTTKSIYTLKSSNYPYEYEEKTARLWAYNDKCNVWIVDGDAYISDTSAKTAPAQKYAALFEKIYPVETNIFGIESDNIYYSWNSFSGWGTVPMANLSDTGTKVNIVVYDICYDAAAGSILGYFFSGDYYPNTAHFQTINPGIGGYSSCSNEGKYFYIDSYYATNSSYENSVISTLAHEFQHMIHFGRKTMNGLDSDTNFNEMLSMLCEDMMQQYLNDICSDYSITISDSDSPKGRLLTFMINYMASGIRQYNSSTNTTTIASYADAYAFGSWLCRQYGGAALVKEMMTNGKTNNDCIVSAVNSLNGKSYSFNDLFGQFIKACYGDTTYTFNKNADQTITYTSGSTTYSYPMTAIDLWNTSSSSMYNLNTLTLTVSGETKTYKEYIQDSYVSYLSSSYDFYGPVYFAYSALAGLNPSYGMFLKRLCTLATGANSVTFSFKTNAGSTKSGMKTYVYIK